MELVLGIVENISGEGENAGYNQHFLLFPKYFQKLHIISLFKM